MQFTLLSQFANLMGLSCPLPVTLTGVAVDSRKIAPGNLFFALPGEKTDGHAFLRDAAAKRAAAAVVLSSFQGESFGLPLLRVPNVLDALQTAARNWLAQFQPQVVAITGSIGKTTTKEFTAALLRKRYRVCASPGNQNSQIGVALSIFDITEKDEIFVIEMGMTAPGHIANLITIAPPDISVITAVELVHAGAFNSIEDIAGAKAEIMAHPKTKIAIMHQQMAAFDKLIDVGSCRKLSFSLSSRSAEYYLEASKGLVSLYQEGKLGLTTNWLLPGRHNQHNFLAAAAVARCLGLDFEEIAQAIPDLHLPERRFQIIEKSGATWVNDSYNACTASVCAALENLPSPKEGGKRIAVLGEMGELGKFSKACHFEVGKFALDCVDQMLCLGDGCQPIVDLWHEKERKVEKFLDRNELEKSLKSCVAPGDVVLVKGSRYHHLWEVLEAF